MGTWGYGIMESDAAMDLEVDLIEQLGTDYSTLDYRDREKMAQTIKKGLNPQSYDKALNYISKEYDEPYDKALAYQVLANIIMENGLPIAKPVFEHVIQKAMQCPEYQNYLIEGGDSDRTLGRAQALEHLKNLSKSYDTSGGKPLEVPFVGLFEKIAQRENNGLINKPEY